MIIKAPRLDQTIYTLPVEKDDIFNLSYVHSVSRQRVEGTFKITETGMIKPLTTEFDSFGPGLPELDGSIEYEIKNKTFIVYHDEKLREHIRLFVSPLTGEQLSLHDKVYDLTSHHGHPILVKIYIHTAD